MREADRRSAELARGLIALGAGKGTHVGLLYPNGPEFVVGMLAAARVGAVVIPFSTFVTAREMREQLVDSDVEILLAAASFRSHDYVQRLADVVCELDFESDCRLFATATPQLRQIGISYRPDAAQRVRDIERFYRLADTVDPALLAAMRRRCRRLRSAGDRVHLGLHQHSQGSACTPTPPCSDISRTSMRSAV